MHWIKDISYIKNYRLKLKFENDEVKEVDLENYLNGNIFKPLKSLNFFRKVSLNRDIDTIVWPNNADYSPDFLYEIGKSVNN
jgi:hypothetical protein